jgi:hypothetical protein
MSTELCAAGENDAPFGQAPSAMVRTYGSAFDDPLQPLPVRDWSGTCTQAEQEKALHALEDGKIVFLPDLAFALDESERRFLDPRASDGRAKNISFDPRTGTLGGTSLSGRDRQDLAALLRRFGSRSLTLLSGLFPSYAIHIEGGRASLRSVSIDGRRMSYRKDDRRLHVDAFPSQPVQGRRILRVFANVNADGAARVWRVGEPFADHARRFLRRPYPMPGSAALLAFLGITKGRRTVYDRLMLSLHDRAKAATDYQRDEVRAEISFPAGSTWIVYTDLVPHAAIAGQHALERTFYLPVAATHKPDLAPLSVLEHLTGRRLLC